MHAAARRRAASCGQCDACLRDDCGKCINCLDKPKYGGPGCRKQSCMFKRCNSPRAAPLAADAAAAAAAWIAGTTGRIPLTEYGGNMYGAVEAVTTTPCSSEGPVVMAHAPIATQPVAVTVAPGANPPKEETDDDSAASVLMSLFGQPPGAAPPPAPPPPPEVPFKFGRPSSRPMARPPQCHRAPPTAPPPAFAPAAAAPPEGSTSAPSDGDTTGDGASTTTRAPSPALLGGIGQIVINGKKMRSARCGQCRGCNSGDCGKCINCVDKPKFGGPGCRKQACTVRTCSQPRMLESSSGNNDDDAAGEDGEGHGEPIKRRKRDAVAAASEAAQLLLERTMAASHHHGMHGFPPGAIIALPPNAVPPPGTVMVPVRGPPGSIPGTMQLVPHPHHMQNLPPGTLPPGFIPAYPQALAPAGSAPITAMPVGTQPHPAVTVWHAVVPAMAAASQRAQG